MWPRPFEPRLSRDELWQPCRKTLRPGRVVEESDCGAKTLAAASCDDIINTRDQALYMLAFRPQCSDAAVSALERFGAKSDLAAGYFVRAQQQDRPSDLLRAFDAADTAAPDAASRFNRALTLETLGLTNDAIRAWDEFLRTDHSPWAAEAHARRNRLIREETLDAASSRWSRNRRRLTEALHARDPDAVAKLIAPFPSTVQRYLDEELLPQWVNSPSDALLEELRLLATELSRLNHDRYEVDVVEALAHPQSAQQRAALREGHIAYAAARRVAREFNATSAAAGYKKAAALLERAGSPLHLLATFGLAQSTGSLALLDRIERQSRERGYLHPLARIQSLRAFLLTYKSSYLEALAAYDDALATYDRLRDEEGVTTTHTKRAGVFRTAGQAELAWREAFSAARHLPHIVELTPRHDLLGNLAAASLALGHPRVALLYQNEAVRLTRSEITATPPEQLDVLNGLKRQVALALRERAGIELHLEQHSAAVRDLDEAVRLTRPDTMDPKSRRVMQARIEEVLGLTLLGSNARGAVDAFTRALALSATDEFLTFRAALFAERADAQRRASNDAAAEADLRASVETIRTEESANLKNARRGAGEDLWSSYFARPQETYHLLIRQLIEGGRAAEAFGYAERARGFEPLNLVLQWEPALRPLVDSPDVRQIQAYLPRGTFIIEYSVLADRTYTWIISRDHFELLTQRARRSDVERWSAALQQSRNDLAAFSGALYAPFDGLIAAPLSTILKMNGGQPAERLIFVADGAMHGMPIAALRNPVNGRYVIEESPIAIAGSATLYVFSLLRDQHLPASRPSALLIGDPAFDPRLGLARLPRASGEVQKIRELYAPNAELRIGDDATVPDFLLRAREHTIVHIAAHAIANPQSPAHSMLILARSGQDGGVLEAKDLLTKLELDHTRLVVLSTCSSADGLPVGPEGVAPLVRPLIAAGVPAVIGSLWDVEDATAEELLVSFHRHYRRGSDAAVALRAAQLDLLRNTNPGLSSVLAWAPFQVIGHASSPFEPTHHK